MISGIDPKVDYAFKHMLGQEANRAILIDVLDAVLSPPPDRRITDIELQDPFNPRESADDKLSILDIKARDQSGRQFNVEMQMLGARAYEKRILYYWAKLYPQQLHKGDDYLELMPTISISFLNHVLFSQASASHLRFRLLEDSAGFSFTDDLEIHILELPKFTKSAAELASVLDIWLYFLRNAATMDKESLPDVLKRPTVLRALEDLEMLAQSDVERERYEARRKFQLDYNTGLKVARLEGLAEGERKGTIGMIHLCERLLLRPETPTEQLTSMPLDELTRLATTLQADLQPKQ